MAKKKAAKKKMKSKKKVRAKKYDSKLAIKVTFDEVLKVCGGEKS